MQPITIKRYTIHVKGRNQSAVWESYIGAGDTYVPAENKAHRHNVLEVKAKILDLLEAPELTSFTVQISH